MPSSRYESSGKSSSFWGIALSLVLHGIVLILVFFWGFGTPKQLGEPQSIEGRLVSISELETKGGGKLESFQPEKKEVLQESRKEEPIEEEKPKEKKVEVPKPKQKQPPKQVKKEEPKKVEVKKEKPPKEELKKKDVVVLDSKEKKKEIAKKPEPTEPPKNREPKETEKKEQQSSEDKKREVLEDMRRRKVLKDIQKNFGKQEQVAQANSPASEETESIGRAGGARSGAAAGSVIGLFIQRIREEIKSSWKIPQTFSMDQGLRTEVIFRMDETGRVHDVRIENTSGNPAFDDFCVKAIYKAAPLTPPPPELLEVAKTEGVKVSFEP
jgi:colicin import membrane protein